MIPATGYNSSDLLKALEGLDQGIVGHTKWLKGLHRSLICCHEEPNEEDIKSDAHYTCQFGKWYYEENHPELDRLDLFVEIGAQHKKMHDLARQVLLKELKKESINIDDYDAFMDQAINFKLDVRRLQYQIIEEVCVVDHLTGAWNRHSMTMRLNQEHERVVRNGNCSSICMLDLDHFKEVNDQFGHTCGDRVLKRLVDICTTNLRSYDSIFRYGGEEFLICLPDIEPVDAFPLLERLRQAIESESFCHKDGERVSITASFGISHMCGDKSIDDVIIEADQALLLAKNQGRNCIRLWNV